MSRNWTIGLQIALGILQALNFAVFPPQAQPYLVAALTSLQAVQAILAHNFNPDGTPATQPYTPPSPVPPAPTPNFPSTH
jgi:hypothetical protein